jgi:hypothetical protein
LVGNAYKICKRIRACFSTVEGLEMSGSSSKILRTVPREEAFYFFTSIGNYTGQSAASLDEFLQKIKDVNIKSIEFHVYREDFEKWVSQTLGDVKLADEIKGLRSLKITGNSLRDRLYFAVSRRLKELKTTPASK